MDRLIRLGAWLLDSWGYLCGRLEAPPRGGAPLASPLWGLWWSVLLVLILVFCGQSSKFIYIDF